MKILQVCPLIYGSHVGGVPEHVRNISERLVKKHEVTIYATDPNGNLPTMETVNGIDVKRFRSWAPSGAYFFSRELRKCLKSSGNFDIIHAHSYHDFPALYASQSKAGDRFIFTPHYHGTGHTVFRSALHIPYRVLGRKIFEKADKVVCVSHYERNLVLKNFNIEEGKIVCIPNGVNLEEFRNLKREKKDSRIILSVGRVEKYKGMQHLVKVLPKLDNDTVLEIVGKGSYKDSLVRLARKLSLTSRVSFFQDLPRTELLEKYASADVFCLLSTHEAYGITVAEALCARTPCIVANTSALTEWIDGRNCLGIDLPVDLDGLASLMNSIIERNVDKITVPDWNEVTRQLVGLYVKVTKVHAGALTN